MAAPSDAARARPDESALEETLGALVGELERRFPYASALLAGATGVRVASSGREQSANEEDPSRGAVFTIYDGRSFHELATSDLAPDALAVAVRGWAGGIQLVPGGPPLIAPSHALHQDFATPMKVDPNTVPLADKLARVTDLQARGQALDPRIVRAQVQYQDRAEERTYVGRGRRLRQRLQRVSLAVLLIASDGEQTRYHFVPGGGSGGYELATISDRALDEAGAVALRLLQAERLEPGEYAVVTDSSVSGVIAHECFGHGVEMDLFPKGRARSAQYLNQRVAAPGVDMYDDPTVPGAFGSYFFDDEGALATRTQILRDGLLVQPISDLTSSTLVRGARTANGRRQDFTRKVYVRMSNTFFGSGDVDPEAMLAGLERGIYLRQAESGMEDPMGWGIQVTAHYGEEYVDGAPTGKRFAPIGISGYVPDLLQSINAIGTDMKLDSGMCGKGHKEMVPVASGGPHLRMKARLG
ncbi:MAG TPA: TldD/PmbA family protein [Ktedonobacterales bacterium]